MAAKKEGIWVSVEYKGVTTPRNFISLVSPFFSHLGIWSLERLFGLHKELQLISQSGLVGIPIWQDDDDESLGQSHKRARRWLIGKRLAYY